jgi:hypothetical protein
VRAAPPGVEACCAWDGATLARLESRRRPISKASRERLTRRETERDVILCGIA